MVSQRPGAEKKTVYSACCTHSTCYIHGELQQYQPTVLAWPSAPPPTTLRRPTPTILLRHAPVVLFVERLDSTLFRLERLALPRHTLGDRVHHGLELLLERVVAGIEVEALLEYHLRLLELAHPEVDGAAAQVALGPRGLQPHALVRVLHGLVVLLERNVGGAAVGEEDMRLLVERERDLSHEDDASVCLT